MGQPENRISGCLGVEIINRLVFRLLMCFQAAYVCFGAVLMREYTFRLLMIRCG